MEMLFLKALIMGMEMEEIEVAAEDGSFGHAVYLYNSDVEQPLDNYEVTEGPKILFVLQNGDIKPNIDRRGRLGNAAN